MKLHRLLALLLTLAMVLPMALPVLQVAAEETEAATEATEAATEATEVTEAVTEATEAATEATEATTEATEATTEATEATTEATEATEPEETVPEETVPEETTTETVATVAMTTVYDFSDASQLENFDLYQSGTDAFTVADGVLKPTGTDGEQKAIINNAPEGFDTVSVDIIPGESGVIYAGFYFGASNVDNAQDAINAQVFLIKSDYTGWTDAPNRIDIVQGSFNNGWTHISTKISETGSGNNLFSGGTKQPLTLKLTFGGDVVLVTLSLKSDSSKYVQYMYEYDPAALQGQIGLRTIGSDTCFDNLTFYHRGAMPENTVIWDFESFQQDQDFTFRQTGSSYFDIAGGKIFGSGESGRYEAILNQKIKNIKSISVDMYPGGTDHFFGGVYLGSSITDGNAFLVGARRDSSAKKPWNEIVYYDVVSGGYTEKSAPHHSTWFANGHKAMNLRLDFGDNKIKVTTTDLADPTKVYSYEFSFNANNFDGHIGLVSLGSKLSFDNLSIAYSDTYTWDFNNTVQAGSFTVPEGTGTATFNGSSLYTSGTGDNQKLILLNNELKNLKSISFDMSPNNSDRFWGGIGFQSDAVSYNILLGGRRTGVKSRMEIVTTNGGLKEYSNNYFFASNGKTRNPIHVDITFDNGSMVITATRTDDTTKVLSYTRTDFDGAAFEGQIGLWVCKSNHYYDNLTITYEPQVQMPSGSVTQENVDTTETHIWDFNDAAQAEDFTISTGTGSASFNGTRLYTSGTVDSGNVVTLNRNWKNIKSISFDVISTNSARNWGGIRLHDGKTDFSFHTGGRRTSSANRDDCDIVMTGASEKRYTNFFTTTSSNTRNNLHVVLEFADGQVVATVSLLGADVERSMTQSAAFDMDSFGGQISFWINKSNVYYDNLTIVCDPYDNTGYNFSSGSVWHTGKTLAEAPKTLEAWVKVPKGTIDENTGVIIGTRYFEPVLSMEMAYYGRPQLVWQIENESARYFTVDYDLRTGQWTHLAYTVDADNDQVICYINGKAVNTWNSPDLEQYKQPTNITPNQTFMVGGARTFSKGVGRNFYGWIADARIWDKPLTADEVNESLCTRYTTSVDGLVFNARLKAPVDNVFADLSGKGYDLTPYVRKMNWFEDPAEPGEYSMIIMPDPQLMSHNYPAALNNMYQWCADNREKENIQIVMTLGDNADNCGNRTQWQRTKDAVALLPDDLPFITVPGNHDYDTNGGWNQGYGIRSKLTIMNEYLPMSMFENYPTEFGALSRDQGVEDNIANTYQAFEVNGNKYLILALEYVPRDDAVEWANEVIESHPNHQVIMITHSYVGNRGEFDQYYLWRDLMSKHDNVIMGWSGHVNDSDFILRREDIGENGNTVYNCMVDYQMHDVEYKGLGMMAILRFTEGGKKCTVSYYSATKDQVINEENQFTWEIDFEPHAVALADGKGYDTVAEAIAAANGGVVKMLVDSDEAITVSADLTIDLAGYTLSNVTVADGATLTLIDTATDDYTGEYGSATVTGTVAQLAEVDEKKYMIVSEDGVYSAHRYYVGVTHVSLDTNNTGFGYKARFYGDEVVQAQVETTGYDLWMNEDVTVTRTKSGFHNLVTLRLKNYMVDKYGETPVNAKAFIILNDGTRLESAVSSYSMRSMIELLNDSYADFTTAQLQNVAVFIKKNPVMESWSVANILAILQPAATVEAITVENQEMELLDGTTNTFTLNGAYTFTAQDTEQTVAYSDYADWIADYYISMDAEAGEGLYLAGNYGSYGWIAIPVEAGQTYTNVPVVQTLLGTSLTYTEMVTDVGTFSCGVADTASANTGATVTVELRLTNPENAEEYITINTTALTIA